MMRRVLRVATLSFLVVLLENKKYGVTAQQQNPSCFICSGDSTATILAPSAMIDLSFLKIPGVTFVTCEQIYNAGVAGLLNKSQCSTTMMASETALVPCQCTNSVEGKNAAGVMQWIIWRK